jgi:lipopolysaccharide export system permease protein
MNLLDRYLIQQFFKNLFLIVCALISLYLLIDFFERIDNFMDADQSLGLIAKYFLLKIPFMLDMLQPVCILLAGVITLGILNHNNEFLALKAGGISTLRIARPLLLVAGFVSFIALFVAELVLPATHSETKRIWAEEVNHKIPTGILRKGRIYFKGKQGIYTFIKSSKTENTFTDFAYTEFTSRFDPQLLLTAQKAAWDGQWTFYNGQTKTPVNRAENQYTITVFDQINLALPERPEEFFAPTYQASEQSISALFSNSRDEKSDTRAAQVDLHGRLSFIFLGIPLIFIGIPMVLIINQKWGQDLSLAIPASCGMAFTAWSWWSTAQSMAKADYLDPMVAAWAMPLLICPLGFWLLKRQE